MELVTERTRCSSCGNMNDVMVKFSRGGPVCQECLDGADYMIVMFSNKDRPKEGLIYHSFTILGDTKISASGGSGGSDIKNALIDRKSPGFFTNEGEKL